MVAILVCIGGETRSIAWPNCCLRRHYERGRLHRERGPAVDIKGAYEAWYQRGDPHRAKTTGDCTSVSLLLLSERSRRCHQGGIYCLDGYLFLYAQSGCTKEDGFTGKSWFCGWPPKAVQLHVYCTENKKSWHMMMFVQGLRFKTATNPVDLFQRGLTDLFLAHQASERPLCLVGCARCDAVVYRHVHAANYTEMAYDGDYRRAYTESALCDRCAHA
jgi:hypothetical protein